MTKSASYNNDYWDEDCFALDLRDDEPCWGDVHMVDDGMRESEDGEWYEVNRVYACAGHTEPGAKYQPERGTSEHATEQSDH